MVATKRACVGQFIEKRVLHEANKLNYYLSDPNMINCTLCYYILASGNLVIQDFTSHVHC